jgi:hypothetical protein
MIHRAWTGYIDSLYAYSAYLKGGKLRPLWVCLAFMTPIFVLITIAPAIDPKIVDIAAWIMFGTTIALLPQFIITVIAMFRASLKQ